MLHRIGEDTSERLDIVPAQFRVLVGRRPKYACRACENVVVQAAAPARLIEGGLPSEATVAQVLVSKYADHLPLYRQAQIYARQGITLDRSTLADWVGRAAWLLRPVHERLLMTLRARSSCAPTRPRRRCSIRDVDAPRPASCGPTRATIAPGAAVTRPAWPMSTPRPQGRAADHTPRRPQGYPTGRWLWRLSRARRAWGSAACLLLGPCPPPLLRTRRSRPGADCQRGARTHRRALRDRERYPQPRRRGAACCPPGPQPNDHR